MVEEEKRGEVKRDEKRGGWKEKRMEVKREEKRKERTGGKEK